jgi:uncharacterized protein YbaA (DUF1428 family)
MKFTTTAFTISLLFTISTFTVAAETAKKEAYRDAVGKAKITGTPRLRESSSHKIFHGERGR